MKKVRLCLKGLLYSVLFLLAFLLLYGLSSVLLSRILVNEKVVPEKAVTLYLLSNGMHTDILMPLTNEVFDWQKVVSSQQVQDTEAPYHYVAMGWGCRKFYLETPTWADLKFTTAFQAVTGQGGTLMHATFYEEIPSGVERVSLEISKESYSQLVEHIKQTFVLEQGRGVLVPTNAVYGTSDAFYEAHGRYHLFFTCNSWTNAMLKRSGIKACIWTPFAFDVMRNYQK